MRVMMHVHVRGRFFNHQRAGTVFQRPRRQVLGFPARPLANQR